MTRSSSHIWKWKNLEVSWNVEKSNQKSSISTVLIHGFGASKGHWRFNQSTIATLSTCYAIDLIGFGESSQPRSRIKYERFNDNEFQYCFDNWGEQIEKFCIENINEPVVLIGNSIGGVIALRAAQLLGEKCRKIILIDCAQRTMDDKRLMEQPLSMRLLRPVIKTLVRQRWFSKNIFSTVAKPNFIEKILKIAYPSGNNVDKNLIDILYQPTQRSGSAEAFRGFINLFDDYLAPDLIADLNTNIDLIWGEKDPWEPINEAEKWLQEFDCVKSLAIIKNAGHCPHDENPEEINKIILDKIQQAI